MTTNGLRLTPQWMDEDGVCRDFSDAANLDRLFVRAVKDDPEGGGSLLDLFVRAGTTTKADDGITTQFVASTADIDRMGDVVDQATWRLGNWRANPVILLEHYVPVVGRGTGRVADTEGGAKRLEIAVRWDTSEHNPAGVLVAHQHANGFRSAGSVGFRPGKVLSRTKLGKDDPRYVDGDKVPEWRAGYVFSHNELLEFSTVAVPANAAALQLSLYAREAEDPAERLRRSVVESVDSVTAEAIIRAVRASAEVRSVLQAAVWGASLTANGDDHPGGIAHLFPAE